MSIRSGDGVGIVADEESEATGSAESSYGGD
jgi:hypothetical protein